MKLEELAQNADLKLLACKEGLGREVKGVYCCDLLSWVMSHGKYGDAWITVQIHPNIVAVAELLEFSCIIVPEEIEVENITLEKAQQEGIPIFQSKESSYKICGILHELGL